jgi:raffinose/stachyose/melibiose transport system substrate-binding protein
MRLPALVAAFAVAGVALTGASASGQRSDSVTVSMIGITSQKPGYDVLIANFERVYPEIRVDPTYVGGPATIAQLETVEFAAGTAPDLLTTFPGCGTPMSVCLLAKAGHLAPMVNKPWAKRTIPLVTSLSKLNGALFTFEPTVSPVGVFTNDTLFRKLGLKYPQTFSQLLALCGKAKAAGTVAMLGDGGAPAFQDWLLLNLITPSYVQDPHFTAHQRAGTASFSTSPGWRQALQEWIEMNKAGCFEAGVTGTSSGTARAEFGLGQGLTWPGASAFKGTLDTLDPQFGYSFRPFPGVDPSKTATSLNLSPSLSVNAHSSPQNQAAAQTFVDFIARPQQNALYAQVQGGLTQYQFIKGQIPDLMSSFAPVFEQHDYVVNPPQNWWNASVSSAFASDATGLLTGQVSIDDILAAMDAAWKQGPS